MPEAESGIDDVMAGLAIAAVACFGVAVAIGLNLDPTDPDKFGLEAAKAALTLGTGLVLGGVLKLVLDRNADRAQLQDEAAKRFDRLLADMRGIHERLETARMLIAAHRTAKTYGERIRDAIDAHVLLLKLAREPGMGVCTPRRQDADALARMLGYLRALQMEYRHKYKNVADRQRFDEVVTTQRFAAAATRWIDGPLDEVPQASREAWDWLNSATQFPVLDDLCVRGPSYEAYFLSPLRGLVQRMLDERVAGLELRPVGAPDWPEDDALLALIATNEQLVALACEERAQSLRSPGAEPGDRSTG